MKTFRQFKPKKLRFPTPKKIHMHRPHGLKGPHAPKARHVAETPHTPEVHHVAEMPHTSEAPSHMKVKRVRKVRMRRR
jgi:hypothetical protein